MHAGAVAGLAEQPIQGVQQSFASGEEAVSAPPPSRRNQSIQALTYRPDENQPYLIPLTRYRGDSDTGAGTGPPSPAASAPDSPSPVGNPPQQPNFASATFSNPKARASPSAATPPAAAASASTPVAGGQLVPVAGRGSGSGSGVLMRNDVPPPRPSLVGGLVKGLARGAVGACVKPIAGVAELLAQTTQGLLVGAGLVAPRTAKLDAAELARRYAVDVALSPHALAIAYELLAALC